MSGKVWLPESSLADDNVTCQSGQAHGIKEKQKKEKAKIVKRTTPTVELRTPPSADSVARKQYRSIERSSHNRSSIHFNLSATSELAHKITELCGWETDQGISPYLSSSSVRRCTAAERGSLSTPADGYRSGVQSRTCSRANGSRRGDMFYKFSHLADSQAYLDDYCSQCSLSLLSFPRENSNKVISEAGGEAEGNAQSGRTRGRIVPTRRLVQHGDPGGNRLYLQQLAKRLGVGVMNEKQLRYRPHPTPPSITKRNRVTADLSVVTQEDNRSTSQEDSVCNNNAIPEEKARELYSRQSRPCTSASAATDSLDLPKVLTKHRTKQDKNKTLSTSSVVKYLSISSRTRHTVSLGLGEEESAGDVSSHGSLGEPGPSSGNALDEKEEEDEAKLPKKDDRDVCSAVIKSSHRGCEPTPFDDAWRDRILTQKARALGLLSRDRVKASLMERINSERSGGSLSCPHTRAGTTGTKNNTVSYRQQSSSVGQSGRVREGGERGSTEPRPKTSHDSKKGEKLAKMRAVYEPGRQKRGSSRQQRHRCVTVLSKRPSTRGSERSQREGWQPETRPGKSNGCLAQHRPGLESEESQYWVEVPNTKQSHSQFHRPQPRTDPYSIPASADDNRIRRLTFTSNASKTTQPPLAVELSGHHYRRTHTTHQSHKTTTF